MGHDTDGLRWLDQIELALASSDRFAVLRAVPRHYEHRLSGYRNAIWACAMTLAYGPVGLLADHRAHDGSPNTAALALPYVRETIDEARRGVDLVAIARDADVHLLCQSRAVGRHVARSLERGLHRAFQAHRIHGEWFRLSAVRRELRATLGWKGRAA